MQTEDSFSEATESLRMPPNSYEGEQSVLGGLLLDNVAWEKIADILTEQDFYRQEHRLIFRAIARLIEQARPADVITVHEELEKHDELKEVGGLSYLATLAQQTPSAANIRRYAEIVRERSIMRQLALVGTEIAESAYNPQGREASQLLDEAEIKYFRLLRVLSVLNRAFRICPLYLKKWLSVLMFCISAIIWMM